MSLKERVYSILPVSYTHLDVYKRQDAFAFTCWMIHPKETFVKKKFPVKKRTDCFTHPLTKTALRCISIKYEQRRSFSCRFSASEADAFAFLFMPKGRYKQYEN